MKRVKLSLIAYQPTAFKGLGRFLAILVCFWTKSKYCHVGISIGDEYIEADPFSVVTKTLTIPEGAEHIHSWTVLYNDGAKWWINDQLGKSYDWLGVLGFVIQASHQGRRDRGCWFCSELAVAIIRTFGIEVCDSTPAWKISPGTLVSSFQK